MYERLTCRPNAELWRTARHVAAGALGAAAIVALGACGGGGDPIMVADPADGLASDCFNAALYAARTSFQLDYRVVGTSAGTATRRGQVVGAATFEGVPGLTEVEVESTMQLAASATPVDHRLTRQYLSVDGMTVVEQGYIDENLLVPSSNTITRVYAPPRSDARAVLAPGESLEIVTTATDTFTTPSGARLPGGSQAQNVRITYRGQESVSVPAGTYVAFKFDHEPQGAGGPVDTEWVQVGTGVQLKYLSGAGTSAELAFDLLGSSRLNGSPL